MELIIDNIKFMLHFSYNKYDGKRTTLCTLHTGACQEAVIPCVNPSGRGLATCSRNDEFVKKTGRKVALAKAMKDYKLTRSERTPIWAAYLAMVGV